MAKLVLTVADHEQNGFVHLAQWCDFTEGGAREIVSRFDANITEEMEPDIKTAPFTFILDVYSDDYCDLISTGDCCLPLQVASGLAPEQVEDWLQSRPDPDSRSNRAIPELSRSTLAGGSDA